jgi:hypothetical protein
MLFIIIDKLSIIYHIYRLLDAYYATNLKHNSIYDAIVLVIMIWIVPMCMIDPELSVH